MIIVALFSLLRLGVSQNVAIMIRPGPYEKDVPLWGSLDLTSATKKDCESMQQALSSGHSFDKIYLLGDTRDVTVSVEGVEQIASALETSEELYRQLQAILDKVDPRNRDTLVVYYTGHGFLFSLFLKLNWGLDFFSGFAWYGDLAKLLAGAGFQHTFLIIDACFSGSAAPICRAHGISLLASSQWYEQSEADDSDDSDYSGSTFTEWMRLHMKYVPGRSPNELRANFASMPSVSQTPVFAVLPSDSTALRKEFGDVLPDTDNSVHWRTTLNEDETACPLLRLSAKEQASDGQLGVECYYRFRQIFNKVGVLFASLPRRCFERLGVSAVKLLAAGQEVSSVIQRVTDAILKPISKLLKPKNRCSLGLHRRHHRRYAGSLAHSHSSVHLRRHSHCKRHGRTNRVK